MGERVGTKLKEIESHSHWHSTVRFFDIRFSVFSVCILNVLCV